MSDLAPCPSCRRHVRESEESCPFCGAPSPEPVRKPRLSGRVTRAVAFAGALAAGGVACGGSQKPDDVDKKQQQTELADAGVDQVDDVDDEKVEDETVDDDWHEEAMPYGAPPVRRRLV